MYEGRPISAVNLMSPGAPGEPNVPLQGQVAQLALNQLRTVPGGLYRAATITEDIARLNRLGRFSRSEARVALRGDGSVEVTFLLVEQPIVTDVQVEGNRRVNAAELAQVVDLLRGIPVDRFQLDRYARAIEKVYRDKGYATATARWTVDDQGVVLFTITEGERVRVMDIRFEGNAAFTDGQLRGEIETRTWSIFTRAPLDDDVLADDIASIVRFYKDRGYLDVEVDRLPPRISPNGKEAIVTFVINEGPIYTFRNVQVVYPSNVRVTAATAAEARAALQPGEEFAPAGPGQYIVYAPQPYSSAQIAGLMELKRGDVYSLDKVNASMRSIEEAFGKLGYVDVREGTSKFQRRELRDPANPQQVDLLLTINPGRPQLTGEVVISGNPITRHDVVRRDLDFRPERPLDWTAVRESERRLRRSNLFDRDPRHAPTITIQPEDPLFPGYRDVLVEVRETSTAQINIGGTLGSDSGLVGRLAYSQRNFDITDFPDSWSEFASGKAFRGGGQTLRLEAQPGFEVSTYLASLTEPALFGSDYSGMAEVSYRSREYDEYDEDRAGMRLRLGRRFGRRWTGSASLRLEEIQLSNIDEDAATDLFDLEGSSRLGIVGFEIQRSTLNDIFLPTEGFSIAMGIEQAGWPGDFEFTRLSLENRIYLPLYRDFLGRTTTISFSTDIGYIPQDADEVPIFERLYRGGSSFRGFGFRAIAPRGVRQDNGEPSDRTVGGTWEFFHSIEITQPVFEEMLYGVVFMDTGTVINEVGFDDYRVSIGAGVRIVIPQLSPAPIALDFGFPIVSQDGDKERLLTFSFEFPF